MPKLPHCARFNVAGPDFRTTSAGSEADGSIGGTTIVTRVGSAVPLTFGSSLKAKVVPLARRSVAWLVTTVPLARSA